MTQVTCPTCKRRSEWSTENEWRPFCSERCKLIDLGAWASEQHAIPGDNLIVTEDNNSNEDSPNNQSENI